MRTIALYLTTFLTLSFGYAQAQTAQFMPTGKAFYIQSAMSYGKNNGGYWDVPGHPKTITKGSNIQVWDLDSGHDREFTLWASNTKHYYGIQVGNSSSQRIDVQGAKKANGTSVKTWENTGKNHQKFLFKHLGNGKFKIYDFNSGKPICLAGRSNTNGSNVHIWDDHDGPWMEWYLIDVKTKKTFVPHTPSQDKTEIEKPIVEKPIAEISYVPEAQVRFEEYKKTDTLTTRRIKFTQGHIDIFSSEPYTFYRIINQKPKLDSETYDASGAIVIDETSQWIFWDKQNNQNTGTSAKIMFYIPKSGVPEINQNTNLAEMPIKLKNKVWSILASSIKLNPVQLKISDISHPQVNYFELNGRHVGYAVSTAKSDVDLIISSYVIFLKNDEVFMLKVTMANDERRKVLEDLIAKSLESITFY